MKQLAHARLRSACPHVVWVGAMLAVWTWPSPPAAAEPSAAERETARSLMDEADRLRASGELWRALEHYKAADALMSVPTTGLEVARTQAQLSQWVEASATAITVENLPVQPGEPSIFAEARRAAAAISAELAPRIPSVVVRVAPASAPYSVNIDGIQLPEAARALPFKANPGDHLVVVQALGFETSSNPLQLAEAEQAQMSVVLTPRAEPPVSAGLAAMPPSAAAPAAPPPASPAHAAGDANAAGRTRGYIGLIAGGLVLGAGAVTGIMATVQTSDIKHDCSGSPPQCPPETQPDIDAAETLSNVANVTIAVGLLGVGYGLFELITHPSSDPAEHALRLGVSPHGASVSIRGAL